MKQFRYTIKDQLGMHARPAGLLTKEAAVFQSKIVLSAKGKHVPANSILGIMGLCAKRGDELVVSIDGEDEESAAAAIKTFLEHNL